MIDMLKAQLQAILPQERELVERYNLPAHPAILDVGGGTGEFERELAQMGPTSSVLGVDVVPSFVEIARRRTAGLAYVRARTSDAAHLPFASEAFDAVFRKDVLHAVASPDEISGSAPPASPAAARSPPTLHPRAPPRLLRSRSPSRSSSMPSAIRAIR